MFYLYEKVQKGVLLTEEDDPSYGKAIYNLSSLPLKKKYITPLGNTIVRLSETEVIIGESNIIHIPKTLPGEYEVIRFNNVYVNILDHQYLTGTLSLTNYRLFLLFTSSKGKEDEVEYKQIELCTLGSITRIEKATLKQKGFSGLEYQAIIHRKDVNPTVYLNFLKANKKDRKSLIEKIQSILFPQDIRSIFCFENKEYFDYEFNKINWDNLIKTLRSDQNVNINGWKIFKPELDVERMKLNFNFWRWSHCNSQYEICQSYPSKFIVPKELTDQQISKVAEFRTQNRVPILSWYNHENGACISRCSQPKTGVNSRSTEDELALSLICSAREQKDKKLIIIDPRPIINAAANRAVGAGYEKKENYPIQSLEFMGIENIHVVRQSLQSVKSICFQNQSGKENEKWISSIESTGWLKHIRSILVAAKKVVKYVNRDGLSCVIHCSDGWDRTSQVVSLAMMCMDPFYRTLTGFCYLIEKEWKSTGHMFRTRIGHYDKDFGNVNRSPIFLQWIDCVWQLINQYPISFEFNEHLLMKIVDESINCRFGTFLTDHEHQSNELKVKQYSVSLWTHIHNEKNMYKYLNILYSPPNDTSYPTRSDKVIYPKVSMDSIHFWSNFYLKSFPSKKSLLKMMKKKNYDINLKFKSLKKSYEDIKKKRRKEKLPIPSLGSISVKGI